MLRHSVLGEVTFEAFVLAGHCGRLRFRAQVVKVHPGAGGYMSMREINEMGANILAAKKQIELFAFSPSIVFPMYETTDQRVPPAASITASTTGACLSAMV